MRKGIGWIRREIGEDHQTKARPFTVPKLHRVPRKLYNGRHAQLHFDFLVANYSLILRRRLPCVQSRTSSPIRLLIYNIRLLHNGCGSALESINIRTICRMEQTSGYAHLVGLSAILPNDISILHFPPLRHLILTLSLRAAATLHWNH